jgi:hypothetical protein
METMTNPKKAGWRIAYRITYSKPEVIDKEEWNRRKTNVEPNVVLDLEDKPWVYLGIVNGGWQVLDPKEGR